MRWLDTGASLFICLNMSKYMHKLAMRKAPSTRYVDKGQSLRGLNMAGGRSHLEFPARSFLVRYENF